MSMSAVETTKNLKICKDWAATEGVDKVMKEHNVDVVVAPADSFFGGVAVGASGFVSKRAKRETYAFTGYPLASVPLNNVKSSGRPSADGNSMRTSFGTTSNGSEFPCPRIAVPTRLLCVTSARKSFL